MFAQQDPISWTSAVVTMLLAGLVLSLAGFVVIAVVERTADGRIGPNRIAGIRTRAARSSEEAWLAAHRSGRTLSLRGGWVMVLSAPMAAAIGLLASGGDPDRSMTLWGITIGVGTFVFSALLIAGTVVGHRAAVRVRDGST